MAVFLLFSNRNGIILCLFALFSATLQRCSAVDRNFITSIIISGEFMDFREADNNQR